jgi:hypothetical protein
MLDFCVANVQTDNMIGGNIQVKINGLLKKNPFAIFFCGFFRSARLRAGVFHRLPEAVHGTQTGVKKPTTAAALCCFCLWRQPNPGF